MNPGRPTGAQGLLAGLAACTIIVGLGCDDTGSDGDPLATNGDASDTRAGDVGADGETEADTGPGTAFGTEQVVSGDGDHDDLAPDLDGDDLVWMRVGLDPAIGAITPDTDCVTCPYCNGCRFTAIYRRLPGGTAVVLDQGRSPRAAPRVGDGVAVWLDDAGHAAFREVPAGAVVRLPETSWMSPTPVPAAGALWWWGYDPGVSGYALMRYDRGTGAIDAHPLATGLSPGFSPPNSQLYNLVSRPPFTVADDGMLFVPNNASGIVRRWRWDGTAEDAADFGADFQLRTVAPIADAIVGLGYSGSCSPCMLEVWREGAVLAPDAAPSAHVGPVSDGEHFVWVDHRDGPYTIMAVDGDGHEVQVSGEPAVVGALSPIAASDGRVAWADRRAGRMRIVVRSLR